MGIIAALDIGGTFTDLVYWDTVAGRGGDAKSATTPKDLSIGIVNCLTKAGLAAGELTDFVHGSTVAINTVLERTGAVTALVVTEGTRDVYAIGRGNRPDAYNIFFRRPRPLVPRERTFEVAERLAADGTVLTELTDEAVEAVVDAVARSGAEAVAVCLLHSYADERHEARLGAALAERLPDRYVSLSHAILREYREYERASTTVLNCYVGPRVSEYLEQLEELLEGRGFSGRLLIMQSNGGVMSPAIAKRVPVAMMESGPVGGISAAATLGRRLGYEQLIAFDMGGTTAKASLVTDGEPAISHGYFIGGYAEGHPLMLPVVDVVEVGTGGGSIARVDEVGALRVGPQSAGGDPGPICYGWGGKEPTVTDANLVLGRLGAGRFLGGEMPLDVEAAAEGIRRQVAEPLGIGLGEAAEGIVEIALTAMALAVRAVSVERGYDPRGFAMVAFGGAGGLHACAIARDLHIPTVIVPTFPGHFSAVGMLESDVRHDHVRTIYADLDGLDWERLEQIVDDLLAEGRGRLVEEGIEPASMVLEVDLDLRYEGQEFSLPTRVERDELAGRDAGALKARFGAEHQRRFRHSASEEAVEVVNARVVARGRRPGLELRVAGEEGEALTGTRPVVIDRGGTPVDVPVYWRPRMAEGQVVVGPAIVEEYASTTVLLPGDEMVRAASGELVISIGGTDR